MSAAAALVAAPSQWYVVGSDFPTKTAYAAASYQLTPPTGSVSRPAGDVATSRAAGTVPTSQSDGPGRPVRSRNVATASSQEIVRPSLMNGSFQYSRFV